MEVGGREGGWRPFDDRHDGYENGGAHNVDEDDRERAGGGGELLSTAMAVRSNELKRCRQGVAVESAGE